jgi:hypothetical protein
MPPMVKRSRTKSSGLEDEGHANQRTHQMCPIGADFKHFYGAKPLRISAVRQGLVNHASQGLVNHESKSGSGDIGLTSLFKSKRQELR